MKRELKTIYAQKVILMCGSTFKLNIMTLNVWLYKLYSYWIHVPTSSNSMYSTSYAYQVCWYAYAIPEVILENNATVFNAFMYCNKFQALVQMQKYYIHNFNARKVYQYSPITNTKKWNSSQWQKCCVTKWLSMNGSYINTIQ